MNRKTFYLAIAAMLVFTSWSIMGLAFAADGPVVLRFTIDSEDNPTLTENELGIEKKLWTSMKAATKNPAPPVYDPEGKIDPFTNPLLVKIEKVEELEPETVEVPDTVLTRWDMSQLELTGTVINGTFRFAAFTTPEGGRSYKGMVGDHIGKEGFKITSIEGGYVVAKLDDQVHNYKTFQ
jgi:Tfp pilus assembly protein PilP